VDVIYIDPPYNTGNKDFKYNDRFVDREDAYRHSKWLSFMHKRLLIAKRLLADTGVIFISIDDNEQAQLKLLCDEVFGEENFVGEIVWFKKRKGSFLSNQLVSLTEYILPYRKNQPIQLFGGRPDTSESQPIIKRTNSKKKLSFGASIVKTKLENGLYKKGLYGKGSSATLLLNDIEVKNNLILTKFDLEAPFVWSQEFLDEEINKGSEILINTLNFQVRAIRHNNDSIKALASFIDGREIGATNEDAYDFLKQMFDSDRLFTYSKPVNLVKKIIESASYFTPNALILDFFAGSGTTLHATMQLNAEDGGNRQCILVTNNENNIAEEVCYERNKRVIEGYTNAKGQPVPGLTNNSLRYYRCETVPRQTTLPAKRLLMQRATELLCIKEGLYDEVPTLSMGEQIRGYGKTGEYLLIIYDDLCIDEAVTLIRRTVETQAEARFKVYVFSNGQYPYTEEFEEVLPYVTLCALPDALYKAYRQVLPAEQAPVRLADEEAAEDSPLTLF